MRNSVLAAALAATVALAGCEEEVPYSTYGQQEEKGVIPGLEVSNARIVLAPVEGNPAALYFDVAYKGDGIVAISGADVEGAGAVEMHRSVDYGDGNVVMNKASPKPVRNGEKLSFEPGDLHMMIMEPAADLKDGATSRVTLKIAGARTHEFDAKVQAAGDER